MRKRDAYRWLALILSGVVLSLIACGGDGGDADHDLAARNEAAGIASPGEGGISQDCSGGDATATAGNEGDSNTGGNATATGGDGGNCTVVIGGGDASGNAGDDNSETDNSTTEPASAPAVQPS